MLVFDIRFVHTRIYMQSSALLRKCPKCPGGAVERMRVDDQHVMQMRAVRRVLPRMVLLFGALSILSTGAMILAGLMVAFVDERTFDIAWWASLSGVQLWSSLLWLTSVRLHWSGMDPWVRAAAWLASVVVCAGATTNLMGALFWALWSLDSQQLVTGTTCALVLNFVSVPMLLLRVGHQWKQYRSVENHWKQYGSPYLYDILPWW